jgi:hypothetical protein
MTGPSPAAGSRLCGSRLRLSFSEFAPTISASPVAEYGPGHLGGLGGGTRAAAQLSGMLYGIGPEHTVCELTQGPKDSPRPMVHAGTHTGHAKKNPPVTSGGFPPSRDLALCDVA